MKAQSRCVLAFTMILVTSTLCAQSVPPPPKPVPDGPPLAETLESLKQTLLASGKLDYTLNTGDRRFSITNVAVDTADCSMRGNVTDNLKGQPPHESPFPPAYYAFEEIDSVKVMTLQESSDIGPHPDGPMKYSNGYVVANNNGGVYFKFADKEAATRVAELLRRASEVCRAQPLQLNRAARDPTLSDTLRFIEQKLNTEASVSYEVRVSHSESDRDFSLRQSSQVVDAYGNPTTCQLRYRTLETDNGKPSSDWKKIISFRRVQKIEELSAQTKWQQVEDNYTREINLHRDNLHSDAVQHEPRSIVTLTTDVTVLRVKYPGGQVAGEIEFSDGEIADRVAKAMNHAAELCRPINKEPF
ncbi:MAG TPA: hypothetical protein VKP58_12465 [Candidatus Acidoferrum sp.]|nr:hypothetical protein [Candidatus Acidoferrum sp.]